MPCQSIVPTRLDCLEAVVGEKDPVGELHHRDRRHPHDQRQADGEHLPVALAGPPIL
ncbi:MAG: hypothetical protein P8X86_11880 [Desulfofustis sp.]